MKGKGQNIFLGALGLIIGFIGAQFLPHLLEKQRMVNAQAQWQAEFEYKKELEHKEAVKLLKEQIAESRQAMIDGARISDELRQLQSSLNHANFVAVYKIHDHGGVPNTGELVQATVLYQALSPRYPINIKLDWIARPLPDGLKVYNGLLMKHGSYYLADVRKHPQIYYDATKSLMNDLNTHSMYGVLIATAPDASYYLNVDFDKPFPKEDQATIGSLIESTASRVRNLLHTKNTPVK